MDVEPRNVGSRSADFEGTKKLSAVHEDHMEGARCASARGVGNRRRW